MNHVVVSKLGNGFERTDKPAVGGSATWALDSYKVWGIKRIAIEMSYFR